MPELTNNLKCGYWPVTNTIFFFCSKLIGQVILTRCIRKEEERKKKNIQRLLELVAYDADLQYRQRKIHDGNVRMLRNQYAT